MEPILIDNRYLLEDEIGHGGYATVYLALDQTLKKQVAIKILKCNVDENDRSYQMFKQEATTMASINNKHVCKIYSTGIYKDNPYIVMEYINGKSLKEIIYNNGSLILDEVMNYVGQIVNGLISIHSNGIIHRDIKPQNIIITSDGNVVLIDFGTAFITEENYNFYHEDGKTITGTAHYMAPEFITNPNGSVESDIYALGISIFEMLTGNLPFNSTGKYNKDEIFMKQINNQFPSIRSYNSDISVKMEKIIYKCCEKDPKRRYHNVIDLYKDMKNSTIVDDEVDIKENKSFWTKIFKKRK